MSKPLPHKARFLSMRDDAAIQRAEQYAKWTLAQLMTDLQVVASGTTQVAVERDYQEMGALLVNNLAAKLAGLLFPTGQAFFKTKLSNELQAAAQEAGLEPTQIASELARIELEACQRVFTNASYNQLVLALKHLIVTGNVLLYRDTEKGQTVAYGMNQFSCRRDTRGTLLDCVLREFTFLEALSADVQDNLRRKDPSKYRPDPARREPIRVELYTRIHRKITKANRAIYVVSQEADELPIGKPGTYPEHLCPWQAPTWSLIAGEHLGRGLVEDYAGGFAKMSDLSEALTLYEIESAKVLNLVQTGAGADLRRMQDAETGEWVNGSKDSVTAYEAGSDRKIVAMRDSISEVFGRLAKAFMYGANTRNAERVTATEVAQDAREAENTLGGTYSALAETLQGPLARLLITEVRPGSLEGLITDHISLEIEAGLPALSRASAIQSLISVTQEAGLILQLTQLDKRIDPSKVMDLVYAGHSVDTEALFKSPEQLREEAQAEAERAQGQQQAILAAGLDETQQAAQQLNQ